MVAGARAPAPSRFAFFAARAARFLCGFDLVGEQARVQRTGRLVFFHVLALGLVALYEVALHPAESAGSLEPNHDRLRHHGAPEFARTASAHASRLLPDSASHHTLSGGL
jgi:hypothetical protein